MSKLKGVKVNDFGSDGIDIQAAMIRHAKDHPDRVTRPQYILWNGKAVRAGFEIIAPKEGRFRLEFISAPREPSQGVDVKIEDGAIALPGGGFVNTLRTWHEPSYEDFIEYSYKSNDGVIKLWNVYHRSWPDGRMTEEKWTGNAGFLVEEDGKDCWLFRCSDGLSSPPDFTQLIFRFSICK
ncbi:hypothetical protein [Oleiagrimonas sp. MCCC 1A03011]|uniref:hypothetical protein n=1 Tax=Oleiagrimonas sp. MCCC 1A03011 TaxID=1926883 RepID=UPI0011BDF934|nr:hypothetical protein [Oleiagrimonas sp. MCCC 1A03011]